MYVSINHYAVGGRNFAPCLPATATTVSFYPSAVGASANGRRERTFFHRSKKSQAGQTLRIIIFSPTCLLTFPLLSLHFPPNWELGPKKKLKQEKVALKLNRHSLLITFVLFLPDFRPVPLGWPEKRARDLRPKGQKVQQQKQQKKNTPTGMFPKPDTWKTITRHGKRTREVKNVQRAKQKAVDGKYLPL